MRITAFFILAACLHVSARGHAQTVTLSERNASIQKVFRDIRKQTGFQFFYEGELLTGVGPITLEVKDAPLEEVLTQCFRQLPVTYSIVGKAIVLKAKETPPVPAALAPPPSAPNNDIHGRVTDSSGNPLVGASVTVKGSKTGVSTDGKGEFLLKGVSTDVVLVVTFTGYNAETVKVSGGAVAVVLHHNDNPLDQVQVIAYGTTSQRFSTANVTTITAADIEKQPVDNALVALEGRVPGLFVNQVNGVPGGAVSALIQGQNSINNGNDPLYVVDGVPYTSELLPTTLGGGGLVGFNGILGQSTTPGASNGGFGSPLSFINPGDIESITVLKDADATAIYGSRAANGAILITTKKGKAGQTKVELNLQDGLGKVTRFLPELNTNQYLEVRREAIQNDGLSEAATDYDINGLWDTTRYTNWQKLLLGGNAKYETYSASCSGGNNNTQFLVGATYRKQTTVFPGDFADQNTSLHFNVNNASSDRRFTLQLSGSYLINNNFLPQFDPTGTALTLPPDAPALYKADGTVNWMPNSSGTSTWTNPIASLFDTYHATTNNLISNAVIGYKVLPGLELRSNFGYTNTQTTELSVDPLTSENPETQSAYGTAARSASYSNSSIVTWIVEPQISYKKNVGSGKLDVLVGSTIEQNNSNGSNVIGSGYNSDAVLGDMLSAATIHVSSTTNSVYKYAALFSRVNFIWQDRYVVDLTARRDGSSRFGGANQFHNFEAVGAGWIFSQEKLIREGLPWMSFGKLRGSYGTTGNDQIGNYQYLTLYGTSFAEVPYQGIQSLQPNGLPNPYLQWEETKKLQVGTDLGFMKDRFLLTVNYVRNRSSNELLGYPLPSVTGFSSVIANLPALVQNTAWEASLTTNNLRSKAFSWHTTINLTIPRNKLLRFDNLAESTEANSLVIGQSLSVRKVFHYLGVNDSTGVYQYQSKTGPTSSPNSGVDNTMLINTQPRYYGGMQNTFNYHGFQLDIFVMYVRQLGTNFAFFSINSRTPGTRELNQPVTVLDRWQRVGQAASIQRYSTNFSIYGPNATIPNSDAGYSYAASYLRFRNLSFSYTFPEKWMKQIKMQGGRLYVHAENLFTITGFKGIDPENQSQIGIAPLRVVTTGVQLDL